MVVEWRFARSITFIPVSEGVVLRERAQRFQKCAQYQPHMSILHISKSITLPQAYTKPLYEHFNKKNNDNNGERHGKGRIIGWGVLGLGGREREREDGVLGFIRTLARNLPSLSKLESNISLPQPVHATD
jgi:hypothetical protein